MSLEKKFAAPALAVVRGVSASFDRCLRTDPTPPDVARAREQHAAYCAALAAAGVRLLELPAADDAPDGCFVDTAVILGASAVITRSSGVARSR